MIQTNTGKLAGSAKILAWGLVLTTLMAASLMLSAKHAYADLTFTVNSTGDAGSGGCNRTECTLREAIALANRVEGADTINFNIPGGEGVKTISSTSDLPITEAVTIDGYTQPGASPNTKANGNDAKVLIELDGTNAGSGADGLRIEADGVTVRGLIVNDFSGVGIDMRGSANKVEGSFIGTNATGTTKAGNDVGVFVANGQDNIVGGASPAARNVISGNDRDGVRLQGTAPLFSIANKVQNNYLGTDKNGTASLGNGGAGVSVVQTPFNVIGGGEAEANVIAFNAQEGVAIRATDNGGSTNNNIQSNSIFSNGLLGIDLNGDGPTANDELDPDAGENGLQNFPVLESAITSSGTTTIKGNLNSTPNKRFLAQFFSNSAGEDEGKSFLGETVVQTDEGGDASFTFTPSQAVSAGQAVTATATDRDLNTSEFSEAVAVEDGPPPPDNKAPVATGDAFKAKKGKTLSVPAPGVLKNDSDPDGDSLTAQLVSDPAKGTLTFEADGSFAYTPNVAKGTDSFTYRVSDGNGGTDTAKVTIKIGKKKK